jgi:hypothetical protein
MTGNLEVFNQLRDSLWWVIDGAYSLDTLDQKWKLTRSQELIKKLKGTSYHLQMITIEEADKIRGIITSKYFKVGTLKQILDDVIEVRCYLEDIFHLTEWPFVKKGVVNMKKGEDLIRKILEEEVKKIKETWAKERNNKKNQKKKEDFEKLNQNWMKVQEKFRAMGHPDWMPNEEEEKKKKGIIGKVKSWWRKWRR